MLWITLYAYLFYFIVQYPAVVSPFQSFFKSIYFVVIGECFGGYHLWYLNAYIEVLIVMLLFLKFRKLGLLWCMIPLFLLLGLLCGSYAGVFHHILPNRIVLSRNFITMGIPFVGIGWMLRKYKDVVLRKISAPVVWLFIIAILAGVEALLLKLFFPAGKEFFLLTIPLVCMMLIVSLKYPLIGSNTFVERVGKDYSLYIYVFHVFILRIVGKIGKHYIDIPAVLVPFIVLIGSILFCVVWKQASKKFFS